MQEINRRPPDSMTPAERLDEVSSLLARGINRLLEASVAKSANGASKRHLGLGYRGDQSVHTDPSTKGTKSK